MKKIFTKKLNQSNPHFIPARPTGGSPLIRGRDREGDKKLEAISYKLKASPRGFTLIELLLYAVLVGSIVLALSIFFSMVLSSRVKNQTIAEVEQQGAEVMQTILQTARNAENITVPAVGANGNSATLDVVSVADDPTVFDLSSGAIRIKKGVAANVNLTSPLVTASGLTFANLTRPTTPGNIAVSFTLTRVNTENKNDYDYTKTFYGTASLRFP